MSDTAATHDQRDYVFFYTVDGSQTNDLDEALLSVAVRDYSPTRHDSIVEVYDRDGATIHQHDSCFEPGGRTLPTLTREMALDHAETAIAGMKDADDGARATVLVDVHSRSVWHVAKPGMSGVDAAREIDRMNGATTRTYHVGPVDAGESGYEVYSVPVRVAGLLEGQSQRDTALAKLFERTGSIGFSESDED